LVIGATIALALRGIARTEAEPAGERDPGAPLIGPRVRAWYRGLHDPLEGQLAGWGIRPDHLTYAPLAVSVLAGLSFARACPLRAGRLPAAAGPPPSRGGAPPRRTGLASPRGAFVDSVVDRCAEAALFVGLGVFFRNGAMLLVVILAAFSSLMVSYIR